MKPLASAASLSLSLVAVFLQPEMETVFKWVKLRVFRIRIILSKVSGHKKTEQAA
jgi:hypothetical protein